MPIRMANHWRWVVMLIVLVLGFSLLAWLGSYLHRRHHRRRDTEATASQPDLRTWGPGQSAHDFGTVDVAPPVPPINEKAKGSREENVGGAEPRRKFRSGSRSLTKSWLRRSRPDP